MLLLNNNEKSTKSVIKHVPFFFSDKSGCAPGDCGELVNHILANCSQLTLAGIMTIGSFDHDYSAGPNPDFQVPCLFLILNFFLQ